MSIFHIFIEGHKNMPKYPTFLAASPLRSNTSHQFIDSLPFNVLCSIHKGQLISFWTKMPTKFFQGFLPLPLKRCLIKNLRALYTPKDWRLKKLTKVYSRFLIEKKSEFFLSFYLHFHWSYGLWNHHIILIR